MYNLKKIGALARGISIEVLRKLGIIRMGAREVGWFEDVKPAVEHTNPYRKEDASLVA